MSGTAEWFQFFRCLLFHGKHRKRTGERRIRSVSIVYETKCERCGCESIPEIQVVEHLGNPQ